MLSFDMKRVLSPINGLLVALAILAVVGCRRNEEVDSSSDGVVRIAPGVRSSSPYAAPTRAQSVTASKSLFADGDEIGIYITRAEDSLYLASNVMRGFDYSNLLYTRAGGTFGTALGSPAGTIYYPYRGVNVDLWGIFPYDATALTKAANKYPWSVKVEQSIEANVLASDFLAARVKGVAPSVNTPVEMEFEHKTARLYARVQIPIEIDGKPIKMDDPISKIFFEGMTNAGRYNFNTNVFGVDPQAAVVSMVPLARGRDTVDKNDLDQGIYLYYELLTIPQTVSAGGTFARIIVNYQNGAQGLFMLELQGNVVLQQGKQQVFEIGFDNNQRLRLDGTKILDWDEVSHTNSDLEENETIRVGNVEWSMGNLVANGASGCRIGEPTDGGLYFHFGSLIGWSGGATGDGTGAAGTPALEVKVKPSAYTGSAVWPAGYTTTGNVSMTANSAAGTGDPCRYYLGSPWRLPTNTECAALYSNVANSAAWTDCATGAWQATPAGSWAGPGAKLANGSTSIFIPVSGIRVSADGSLGKGSWGYCWSSVQYDPSYGYFLNFDVGGVGPQDSGNRPLGLPVRCVKDAEVTDQP